MTGIVSVVIPAHMRPDLLSKCLKSLVEQQSTQELHEVIVVENGGKSGLDDVCQQYQGVLPVRYEYLHEGNVGAARNHGANLARGELILFLDDDVRAQGRLIQSYVKAFNCYKDTRIYGGGLDADYERQPPAWLTAHFPPSAAGLNLPDSDSLTEPCLLGGNLAIPALLWRAGFQFDRLAASGQSNHGFIGEETRLQQKLINTGVLVCAVRDARVWHWVPADRCTLQWLLKRRERSGRTEAQLLKQSLPLWVVRAFTEAFFCEMRARFTRAAPADLVKFSMERAYLLGYIKGVFSR